MQQYLNSVISWFGNMQFLAVMLMLWSAFPLRTGRARAILTAALCLAGFALTNGVFNMMAETRNAFGLYAFIAFVALNFIFNWLFGRLALKVDWRQLTSSLLYDLSFLELLLLITMTIAEMLRLPTIVGQLAAIVPLLAVAWWIHTSTHPFTIHLPDRLWVIVCVTPVLMNVLITLWQGQSQGNFFLMTGIVLLAMDLCTYYFFDCLVREMTAQIALELDNQVLLFHLRQMDDVQALLDSAHTLRHELKAHFFLIDSLIQKGQNEEALEYIHKTIEPAFQKEEIISTGNAFVDMVLSQKVAEARRQGIPTALNVILPPSLEIQQQALCSLLFNLWDNAIEASGRCTNPDIRFEMGLKKGYLSLVMRNRIDASVLEHNPELHTSKKDPQRHGVGLRVIRKIVENAGGDLKIYEENGYFVTDILMETNVP